MKHQKLFSFILLFTALALSACAAYFSVYGIAGLFSGALLSVAVMAGALEIAKLVTASFLFRFWSKTKTFLKIYMSIGVIVLLLITSAGIFGFLSSAYQKSKTQNIVLTQKMEIIDSQKANLQKNIESSRSRVEFLTSLRNDQEKRLSSVIDNESVTRSVIQLQEIQGQTAELIEKTDNDIEVENNKIESFMQSIVDLEQKAADLNIESLDQKDITTFKFVAQSLEMEMDSVVKYFMLALIFVFDPLAIAMLLAYNTIVMQDFKEFKRKEEEEEEKEQRDYLKKELESTTDVIKKELEVASELSDVLKKEIEVVEDKKKDKVKEEPKEEIDYANRFLGATLEEPKKEVIKKEVVEQQSILEKNDVSQKDETNYQKKISKNKKAGGFKKIMRKPFFSLRRN